MRLLPAIAALLVPMALFGQYRNTYAGLDESDAASEMRRQISFLSSEVLEGRGAGTNGEKEAAEYVTEQLSALGLDILSGKSGEEFGLRCENGDTLVSRNVLAFIPGYDPELKGHYILIGARLDNIGLRTTNVDGKQNESIYCGANGNASGLAMLLYLAKTLKTNSVLLKRSVIIAAFGASSRDNAGSWYFLNRSFKDVGNIDAMINLDMLGTGSRGFFAYTASNPDMNNIILSVSGELQPVKPTIVAHEPVRSDHRSFYSASIPSVFFTTGMYPEYNTPKDVASIVEIDKMELEAEYIYNFTISLANGRKPDFATTKELTRKSATPGVVSYYDCDVAPKFLNSSDPTAFLRKWVYVYLRYPQECVKDGIQGRVLVEFTIDEKGKVGNVKVKRGVDPLLDEEAVRVISASPDWKPGIVNGTKVKTELSLYVDFKLQKRKNR